MENIKIGKFSLAPWQIGTGVIVVGIGIYSYIKKSQTAPVPVADPGIVNPSQMLTGSASNNSGQMDDVYNTIAENNKEIAKAFDNISRQFESYQSNTSAVLGQTNATMLSYQNSMQYSGNSNNDETIKAIYDVFGIDVSKELKSGGRAYVKDGMRADRDIKNVYVENGKGETTKIITKEQATYNSLSSGDKAKVDSFVKDNKVDIGIALDYFKK